MSVNRYEVTIEDSRTGNYYSVLVSTVDEKQAIKIAKRRAMEQHNIARDNVICRSCEELEK
mgnify:CR=1 FL=1